MKYQIMMSIMMHLLSRKTATAKQLAARYEISERSVYRYLNELVTCGVPVDTFRGRYGGIKISDTYRLPSGFLSKAEYAAAADALTAMYSQIHDENILSALEKLKLAQKSDKKELSVCGNIIVDGGSWSDLGKFSEKMKVCENAVNESKSILIDYISRDGVHSKRVIDPHVLVLKQNVWYVYAFCHTKQEFRTFKIGRIKSATYTGKTFEKKKFTREDIKLNFWYSKENSCPVVLEIDKSSLADAEEWLGIDNIEPRGKGFIAELTLPDDGGLVNKILSYGGAIRVLNPPELKDKVLKAAQRIADGKSE